MSVYLNPQHYDNMYLIFPQQKLGSSLNFSASGGWDKEKKEKAAEKFLRSPSEGAAEGGCGGNSAAPERSNFAVRIFVKKSSDFVQKVPPDWQL